VPPNLQSYCLNVVIWGAVILRGVFIFLGLQAIETFRPLLLFFAAFLIYASYQGLASDDDDDDDEEEEVPEFVANIQKQLPTTDKFEGEKLWVQNEKGETLVTPLATCIIAVELCDVLFAVDSIPAVFAVTSDPLVVFGSNIAAILGLRSLYQVLSVAAQDLVYLEKAVAVVLGFVGVKLGLEVFGVEVSSLLSLGVIIVTLGVGIAASVYEQNKDEYSAMIKKIPVSNFQKLIKGLGDIGK
jgi:TerC family integral membrane protein